MNQQKSAAAAPKSGTNNVQGIKTKNCKTGDRRLGVFCDHK